MAYDDEQARRSRVVVETPTSKREVTQTESYRNPERNGISGATVGVIVVVAIALITVVVLFLMNGQQTNTANDNLAAQQAQQPPVVAQQPAPAAQQPPVIIQQPAPAAPQPLRRIRRRVPINHLGHLGLADLHTRTTKHSLHVFQAHSHRCQPD